MFDSYWKLFKLQALIRYCCPLYIYISLQVTKDQNWRTPCCLLVQLKCWQQTHRYERAWFSIQHPALRPMKRALTKFQPMRDNPFRWRGCISKSKSCFVNDSVEKKGAVLTILSKFQNDNKVRQYSDDSIFDIFEGIPGSCGTPSLARGSRSRDFFCSRPWDPNNKTLFLKGTVSQDGLVLCMVSSRPK